MEDKEMRLAKYLARAGIASRRSAEKIIAEGRVSVNGELIKVPQTLVSDRDRILVDGRSISRESKKIYLLLNKPSGCITTLKDTHNRSTVLDLLDDINLRVFPVGRLDYDTSGALLLTNDGELAFRLTHPGFGVEKKYRAWVRGIPGETEIKKLRRGVLIEGEKTAPAKAELIKPVSQKNIALLELILKEGKKRQVKMMCSAIGHPVRKLHRVAFAGLELSSLKPGEYRKLSEKEIGELYRLVGLKRR